MTVPTYRGQPLNVAIPLSYLGSVPNFTGSFQFPAIRSVLSMIAITALYEGIRKRGGEVSAR